MPGLPNAACTNANWPPTTHPSLYSGSLPSRKLLKSLLGVLASAGDSGGKVDGGSASHKGTSDDGTGNASAGNATGGNTEEGGGGHRGMEGFVGQQLVVGGEGG